MLIKNRDIAQLLNISTATVSLARNNRPGVSDQTRNSVNEAIRELMAREMKSSAAVPNTEGIIAFVIHKKHGLVIADTPFFLSLTEAIQKMASLSNYSIHILLYDGTSDISEHLSRCRAAAVSGILLLASELEPADLEPYVKCGKPLVLVDSHYPTEQLDSVILNNRDAIRECVLYAWNMGHRKIGCLRSSVYTANFNERFQSYLNTMHDLGLPVSESDIFSLRCTADTAYKDMKDILAQKRPLPTLLVSGNDILVIGALKALKESKIVVPDDVSLIGFDDMPISRMMDPPLTSISVDIPKLARVAIRRLIEKIKGDDCCLNIEVYCALTMRNSVVKIAAGD